VCMESRPRHLASRIDSDADIGERRGGSVARLGCVDDATRGRRATTSDDDGRRGGTRARRGDTRATRGASVAPRRDGLRPRGDIRGTTVGRRWAMPGHGWHHVWTNWRAVGAAWHQAGTALGHVGTCVEPRSATLRPRRDIVAPPWSSMSSHGNSSGPGGSNPENASRPLRSSLRAPHPALRATFSRREKGWWRRQDCRRHIEAVTGRGRTGGRRWRFR
jgi:hypothetical protein